MRGNKVKIFVCTHKPAVLPVEDNVFELLQVGAASNGRIGILSDDTGDNISAKNCFYGELTGLYWVWKNYTGAEIIGICHYRRFFLNEDRSFMLAEDFERALEGYDVLLSSENKSDVTYKEGFGRAHNIQYLNQTGQVIQKLYPDYYDTFLEHLESKVSHFGNLSVMKKSLFDEYCEWLFSIFTELEKIVDLSGLDDYHKRLYGFLSEGLLEVFAKKRGLKINSGKIGFTDEKSETKELKLALTQLVRMGQFVEAKELFYGILKIRPDVELKDSDIFDELHYMEMILYILDEERKIGVEKGLYSISHELFDLVKYVKKVSSYIKKENENQPLTEEEIQIRDACPVSDIAKQIISLN